MYAPDDAAGAASDGADGRDVLGGDLEEVAVHVVLHVAAAVRVRALDLRLPAVAQTQAPSHAGAAASAASSAPLHAHVYVFYLRTTSAPIPAGGYLSRPADPYLLPPSYSLFYLSDEKYKTTTNKDDDEHASKASSLMMPPRALAER